MKNEKSLTDHVNVSSYDDYDIFVSRNLFSSNAARIAFTYFTLIDKVLLLKAKSVLISRTRSLLIHKVHLENLVIGNGTLIDIMNYLPTRIATV